jgi:hypothetical protein
VNAILWFRGKGFRLWVGLVLILVTTVKLPSVHSESTEPAGITREDEESRLEPLLAQLKSDDPWLRGMAVNGLARIRTPEAVGSHHWRPEGQ